MIISKFTSNISKNTSKTNPMGAMGGGANPPYRASPVFPGPGAPWHPLTLNLASFTSRFTSILTNITSKFSDSLGLDCM